MRTFDPAFIAAHVKATGKLMDAVLEFEKTTGRLVDSISLVSIEVTEIQEPTRRYLRTASIECLPTPGVA